MSRFLNARATATTTKCNAAARGASASTEPAFESGAPRRSLTRGGSLAQPSVRSHGYIWPGRLGASGKIVTRGLIFMSLASTPGAHPDNGRKMPK